MAKSTDEEVTTDLIETLEDGRSGFEHAAKRLEDSDRADIASRFAVFSAQRAEVSTELEALAANSGDDIDEDGSIAAAVDRGWISVKDAVTGVDVAGVLTAALTGEDHAISENRDALDQEISAELRDVVERQIAAIEAVHFELKVFAETDH